jgi:hypothetical protein
VVSFTSWPLYLQGKSPWYPLDRRSGGLQSWSGCGSKEKKSMPLLGAKQKCVKQVKKEDITEETGRR